MIVKFVGAVMVVTACIATSKTITSIEKEKAERLDSFITLIRYIRNKIDCYAIPIDKIFADCPDEILHPLGGKSPNITFGNLIVRKGNVVGEDARRILEEFGETLGRNYRDRQIKLCDGAISALESVRDAEIKKYLTKKKTVNALCLAAGGMIIILLL